MTSHLLIMIFDTRRWISGAMVSFSGGVVLSSVPVITISRTDVVLSLAVAVILWVMVMIPTVPMIRLQVRVVILSSCSQLFAELLVIVDLLLQGLDPLAKLRPLFAILSQLLHQQVDFNLSEGEGG
jgi:hypothetical protein